MARLAGCCNCNAAGWLQLHILLLLPLYVTPDLADHNFLPDIIIYDLYDDCWNSRIAAVLVASAEDNTCAV